MESDDEVVGNEFANLTYCQPCGTSGAVLPDLSGHYLPVTTPVCTLEVREAFELLTKQEKEYAFWIGSASWAGSVICLRQCSPESVSIFCLLLTVFSSLPIKDIVQRAKDDGMDDEDISRVLVYAAGKLV